MRYEHLREHALDSSANQHSNWGLLLFLRRGLAAWMRAWPETSSPETRREEATREEPEERMRFSAELRDEVVSVLVNMVDMVLHKQQEVFT